MAVTISPEALQPGGADWLILLGGLAVYTSLGTLFLSIPAIGTLHFHYQLL